MLNLYSETILKPKFHNTSKRIEFSVPRADGSYNRSKHSQRLQRSDRLAGDEKSFVSEYLATSSAVFSRQTQHYPRQFIWRVIAQSKILEIRVADFVKGENDEDHDKTLAFEFQDAISPTGVSVCEDRDHDKLHFFVLTQSNEVFDIRLEPGYFAGRKPKQSDSLFTPISTSSLSIDTAYRIHAASATDLYLSFLSGKVQHWRRGSEEQQTWSYTNYDDKSWAASVLSLVSRKGAPDIEYDGRRLAHNTAHAMAACGNYLFTTCLNHTLRIWHLHSGTLVDHRDLLDKARQPQERIQLSPAEPGYVRLLDGGSKHEKTLLTYSPLNGGSVKMWTVRGINSDQEDFEIEDQASTVDLRLPDPDPTGNSIWSLVGLEVIKEKHSKAWQIWILWRNNNYHKAYSLNFDQTDLASTWAQDWVSVSTVSVRTKAPDLIVGQDEDSSSKWLDFIMFPGRYSPTVIETTLAQYQKAADIKLTSGERNRPLEERLCLVVSSQVSLRRYDDVAMDHDRFAIDTDQQWRHFWRMLEALNESSYAPLSLSCDETSGSVWLAMSGLHCAVRECNDIELLQLNQSSDVGNLKRLAQARWPYRKFNLNPYESNILSVLLRASGSFFASFPPELLSQFMATLEEDLYTTLEVPVGERIVAFFNSIDFANAVPDDVERELTKEIGSIGGFSEITNDRFTTLLGMLVKHRSRHNKPSYTKTSFGVDLIWTALLDEIVLTRDILLSMLAITIFIDQTDKFDPRTAYTDIINQLRVQERNLWLATHNRVSTADGDDQNASTLSVLQDIYANHIRPTSTNHHPMPYVLTRHVSENLDWISGSSEINPEDSAVWLQCNLLKHNNITLAADFLKFQPSTPWSVYIKGRLSLELDRPQQAAVYFRKCSRSLATGRAIGDMHRRSSELLTNDQAASFFDGLPKFYEHVLSLFEDRNFTSYVIDFARLSLEALKKDGGEAAVGFRQDIVSRLFNAELRCSHFTKAFNTLTQFDDIVLQRISCTDLINGMLSLSTSLSETSGIVGSILALPWTTHPALAAQLDSHLSTLASEQTTIPSSVGRLRLTTSASAPDYLAILHAVRLSKSDHRGAVGCLFDRLRLVQKSARSPTDAQATNLRHALLALINALTCVDQDEAYIIVETDQDPRSGSRGIKRQRFPGSDGHEAVVKKRKKVVITIEDLRREYQQILDKCSRIERGDFEFGEDGDLTDEDVDMTFEGSRLERDKSVTNGVS